MKPTLYLPMLLMLTASTAQADEKPQSAPTQQTKKESQPETKLDRAALEKEFAEKLTGSTLTGLYTVDGQKSDKLPSPDSYELARVAKVADDKWSFQARMKYGEHDVTLPPITLTVEWAGDTPMISLTDFTIPLVGTFTSRIFFYGDRYAGTWQHGPAGGHMWGKIERTKKPADAAATKQDEKPKKDTSKSETN